MLVAASQPKVLAKGAFFVFAFSFGSVPGILANDPPEDPGSRSDELLKVLETLEKSDQESPSVLGDVDIDHASAVVLKAVRVLKTTRTDLVLEKQSLESTVELLQKISGLTFVISAKAREAIASEKPEVSTNLRNLPLENVLNLISAGLPRYRFTLRYGAVVLLRTEEYRPRKILRIYDVRDILHQPRDFPAPSLGLKGVDESK